MNHARHEQSAETAQGGTIRRLLLASSQPASALAALPAAASTPMPRLSSVPVLVIALVLGILALRLAQDFLVPLVLGLLIAYALDPIVRTMHRLGVPRWLGAAAIVAGLVLALGGVVYALGDRVTTAINQLPEATGRLRRSVDRQAPSAPSERQRMIWKRPRRKPRGCKPLLRHRRHRWGCAFANRSCSAR
jgi:hypothetical protein